MTIERRIFDITSQKQHQLFLDRTGVDLHLPDSQDDYTQQSIEETKESIALLGEDDDVEDCVYNSDDDDDGDDDDDELVVDNNSSSSSATNY